MPFLPVVSGTTTNIRTLSTPQLLRFRPWPRPAAGPAPGFPTSPAGAARAVAPPFRPWPRPTYRLRPWVPHFPNRCRARRGPAPSAMATPHLQTPPLGSPPPQQVLRAPWPRLSGPGPAPAADSALSSPCSQQALGTRWPRLAPPIVGERWRSWTSGSIARWSTAGSEVMAESAHLCPTDSGGGRAGLGGASLWEGNA